MALNSGSTLFEAVPALSTVARQGQGVLKLVPINLELPPIELREGVNRFGRDPEQADHVIDGTQVSRLHCVIVVEGTDIWVRDLGSHNGTYINRERISEAPAKAGDEISVSRMASFRLVRDEEIAQVAHVHLSSMEEEEGEKTRIELQPEPPPRRPAPVSAARMREPTNSVAHMPRPQATDPRPSALPPAVDDAEVSIEQLERQRNVLAILYQISLRCLLVPNPKEREQLLSNVLPRLTTLDAGFILYQTGVDWRASICPGLQAPPDPLVKACFRLARSTQEPTNLDNPAALQQVGMTQGGALVIPLVIDDQLLGVIGAISFTQPFSLDDFDIVTQFGNVTAAALRS